MTDLIMTNRGGVKKSLIQGYRVFTPWYWVAFDWTCKVAAVGVCIVTLVAFLPMFDASSIPNFQSARLFEAVLLLIFYIFAIPVLIGIFIINCNTAYFLFQNRYFRTTRSESTGLGVFSVFLLASACSMASGQTSRTSEANVFNIAMFALVLFVVLRFALNPLKNNAIELQLQDGSSMIWTGLADSQSTETQNELTTAMSETTTPP